LPHKDAGRAAEFILKNLPEIPFWPQLPKRDIREGMVAQFSENLPCLRVAGDGIFWDNRDCEKELEVFYNRIISGESIYFKITREFAAGFYSFYERFRKADRSRVKAVKCQITGPFSFAASINNKEGVALLHDEVFMQAVLKGLAMKAQWQIEVLREFKKKIILFIDEPYLAVFGSAFSPLSREKVVSTLSELAGPLKAEDVLIGVHCCGNTDWSIFTDVPAVDIISFDAYGFQEKILLYAADLAKFFGRGGFLCWGIVPTQDFSPKLTAQELAHKVKSGIQELARKGVDPKAAENNLLVSPSCGLGSLDEAQAVKIFGLLSEVSALLRS